jgi:tetratricopeptide (TPR) repeat protein
MTSLQKASKAALILLFVATLAFAQLGRAQNNGTISGQVLDINGKPWAGLTIQAVSDQGSKSEAKSDNDGKYRITGLRAGIYDLSIAAFPPPNDKQPAYQFAKVRVQSGNEEAKADANFKDIMAKQGAAAQEQLKKQEEEKQKFAGMKQHFDAGVALLEQEKTARADLQKATPDQRDAAKQKVADLSNQAATELQAAQKGAPEKDPNQHILWAKLAEAYDVAGRNDEAGEAYQQAVNAAQANPAIKGPQIAGYYNNLGNVLARAGKIDDAKAAYTKSAETDPPNAATAWRNFGISLYNAGRLKEAVEPLKKATEIDPKSAQAWYLLGAALVGSMETKKEGDKLVFVVQPGTAEAYQKALELDPNGPYGAQAKQGLEALSQIAPGIDTKINVKKKKS